MARSIVNESDERIGLVENAQEGTHDVQILPFSLAPDVVDLSQTSSLQHFPEGHDVIDHEEPVPNIATIAVDGEGLVAERARDHQWDQLLRKLVWPIVVRAPRDDGGEGECLHIGSH